MMVVLLVMTAICMMLTPLFSHSLAQRNVSQFVQEVEADLMYYQLYAMVHRSTVRINLTTQPVGYRVSVTGEEIGRRHAPSEISLIFGRTPNFSGIQFTSQGRLRQHVEIEIERGDSNQYYVVAFQIIRGRFHIYEYG
ncbi:hypothetical protein BBEV_1284 [Salisediminibacterium beveridgei]|uniref:Competence protein ComGD n=2 Tax=Salisediminibacterium beveridgei TaxID=632773 RepID=A0A1D7QUJ5_9BACI|nr:hypothetical protein BBEV_1284 [Salisediminibacterium beveridgei]